MVNHNDPNEPAPRTRRKAKRLGVLLVVVVLAFIILGTLWGMGYFRLRSSGELRMPQVSVEQGAMPDLAVDTADVHVSTKEKRVEVPAIDVEKPAEKPAPGAKENRENRR